MYKTISFKKKLLASAVASVAVAGFSSPLFAQDSSVEELVVTGIKGALQRSVDIKRNSNQVVEAITADEIGKMPDQNVADSLQRVPGVQIDRAGGEGTKVRIRGLGQNITLLNGESFISGMEYYQNGEGRTEFGDSLEGVPSELLGGVEVIKTPRASDVEGGIGGIVNLKTRNPLDLKEPVIAGNVKFDKGHYSGDMKPSATIVIGNNWDNFGAIFSLSASQKTVHVDEAQNLNRNSFGWHGTKEEKNSDGQVTGVGDGNVYFVVPGMQYETDKEFSRERVGASLALAWSLSDATQLTFDWFHSDLNIDDRSYSMKYTMNTDGGALLQSARLNGVDDVNLPYSIDSNGVVTSGAFSTSGENNSYRDITDISTDNFKLGFKSDMDAWHFDGALSMAKSDLTKDAAFADARYQPYGVMTNTGVGATGWQNVAPNDPYGEKADGANPDTRFIYMSQSSSGTPNWGLSPLAKTSLTNPDSFMYKSNWAYGDRSTNDSLTLALNATYDLEFADVKRIKFGLRHSNNEVDFTQGQYMVNLSSKVNNQGVEEPLVDGHSLGDIDGDGIPDNQLWGAYTYYVDANISNPAFNKNDVSADPVINLRNGLTSTGRNVGDVLYDIDVNRWDGTGPGVIPWQSFNDKPSYYVDVKNFFPSGGAISHALFVDPAKMTNPAKWLSSIAAGAPVEFFKDAVESWNVETETTAVYFETELEGDAIPYNLDLGVRIVKTDTTTSGAETSPDDLYVGTDSWNGPKIVNGTFSRTKSYTDVLPSLNFSLNTADDQKLRFAMARVMARPDAQKLGHGANYNFTRNDARGGYEFVNGTIGNPNLDPYRATQADLSYEWYFDDLSYVSVGTFVKVVDSFLIDVATPTVVADSTTDGETEGQVNSTANGTGGNVKGFEIALQKAFDNGLGFAVNYTYSDSSTDLESTNHKGLPLPGVSKNTYNLMGFYENNNIHARISYTWRDEYLSPDYTLEQISGLTAADGTTLHETNTFASFYDAYGQLDMSLSYDITDNFSLTAEGINLTSEEQRRYIEFTNFFRSNAAAERRFVVGAKFQF